MPYEIIRETRGAYKRFWGIVTPQEFLDSVRNFHNDQHFETVRYSINDFTETERFELSDSHIDDTAAINVGAAFSNPNVRILAVTCDARIIGMARKYDQITKAAPILIFPTLAEARRWLNGN